MSAPVNAPSVAGVYRTILLTYPRRWRAHRAEEVLAVLMDDAASSSTRRGRVLVALDLLVHGLIARLDSLFGVVPDELRRRIVLLATICGTAVAVLALTLGEWLPAAGTAGAYSGPSRPGPTPVSIAVALYLAWVAAWLLMLTRRPHAARLLLATLAVATALTPAISTVTGSLRPPLTMLVPMTMFAVLAASATAHVDVRARRAIGLTTAVGIAALYVAAGAAASIRDFTNPMTLTFYRGYQTGLQALANVAPVAVVVAVVVGGYLSVTRRHWFTATLAACLPWAVLAFSLGNKSGAPTLIAVSAALALVALFRLRQRRTATTPTTLGF